VRADGGEVIELASLAQEVWLAIVSAGEYVSRFQERLRERGIKKPESDLPSLPSPARRERRVGLGSGSAIRPLRR